jgi:hypothetical protein
MFHLLLSLLFAVDEKPACTTRAELARFVGSKLIAHVDFPNGQRIARRDDV